MKSRPWLTLYILLALSMGILGTIPLGVTAQERDSWSVYETTWTQIDYENVTTIWIRHPANGSLVSNNQKLNFIVVPFDADMLTYKVDVYKNDIHMYSCNKEIVYDLDIYTTNPINDIVTIIFRLNNQEVLKLEYIAILLEPSLDMDFTEQWLIYQAEKENQSMSGSQVINMRDKYIGDLNLVVNTGIICILFVCIAGIIVVVFQLINMINLFTGIVMFFLGFMWLDNMNKTDAWMRSIEVATPNDVFVYWARIAIFSVMVLFAFISYVIGYKIAKTRLNKMKFMGMGINDRELTEYNVVVGHRGGKKYWIFQDSWSALKRVFGKVRHEIKYDEGDITDVWTLTKAKEIPENISTNRYKRKIFNDFKTYYSRLAFRVKPKKSSKKKIKIKKLVKPKEDRKYNYDIFKYIVDGNIIGPAESIVFIDGRPEPKDILPEDKQKDLQKELREREGDIKKLDAKTSPDEMEGIFKRLKLFKRQKQKPIGYEVRIKPSNRNSYDLLHFLKEANYLQKVSNSNVQKDKKIHQLELELEIESSKKGKEYYLEREKYLKDLKGRKEATKGA